MSWDSYYDPPPDPPDDRDREDEYWQMVDFYQQQETRRLSEDIREAVELMALDGLSTGEPSVGTLLTDEFDAHED